MATENPSGWRDPGLIIRTVLTAILLVVCAWWLWVVASNVSIKPVMSDDGKIIFDQFARAKDVMLAVLPLLTLALGYWFGSAGTAKAEEKADKAQDKADKVQRQVAALTDVADPGADLLNKAQKKHPEAFGLPTEDTP